MTGRDLTTIIIADDDVDDRMLIEEAFRESRLANPRIYVEDGQELIDYLGSELSADRCDNAAPALIVLDLNMPRLDGRAVLKHLKADALLRRIPVVVFTTSKQEEDILRTYDLGVNSFITKPVGYEALLNVVKALKHFWIDIAQLPVREPT